MTFNFKAPGQHFYDLVIPLAPKGKSLQVIFTRLCRGYDPKALLETWNGVALSDIAYSAIFVSILIAAAIWLVHLSSDSRLNKYRATNALILVFPPVRHGHPSQYAGGNGTGDIPKFTVNKTSATILLDAPSLFNALVSGGAEAKDGRVALHLIDGKLRASDSDSDSWKVVLSFNPRWRWKSIRYALVNSLSASKAVARSCASTISRNGPCLDLDFVPLNDLECTIYDFARHTSDTARIEFSCVASKDKMQRDLCLFVLMAEQKSRTVAVFSRTPEEIFDTVSKRLGRTSGKHIVMANISAQRAHDLIDEDHVLTFSRDARSRFVSRYGLQAWRERRVLLTWEAGLLNAGVLQRWQVKVLSRGATRQAVV